MEWGSADEIERAEVREPGDGNETEVVSETNDGNIAIVAPADAEALSEPLIRADSDIASLIYTARGLQVMLDSDLAMPYGVETGDLNRAAVRTAERFPDDFRFKLTSDEWESLLFQIGRAKTEGRGGRRTPSYAYSQEGIAMLSAILKSETAV